MWLCCLTAFRFLNPLYQLDCVCRVEAEEDNQDFRLFDSAINPFESLVFFLYPQAVGQISCNVIYQFVIGQRIPWDDSDTTDWGGFFVITYKDIPSGYPLCLHGDCPMVDRAALEKAEVIQPMKFDEYINAILLCFCHVLLPPDT